MSDDNRAHHLLANQSLLDALPVAVIATDASGAVVGWNAAATSLYGWSADEAIGRPIVELTPELGAREAAVEVMRTVTAGAAWTGEFAVRRKDGTSFLARVTLTPVLDKGVDGRGVEGRGVDGRGVVVGLVGLSEDISEQRFLATRDADSNDRLRLALDASGLGAWEWDVGTGRVHWDARMEEIFGFARGTFPGTYDAWFGALHPHDRPHILSSVQQAVALKSRNTLEHRILRQGTGEVRWIESHSQPVVADDGTVRGTIGCVRDITDLKQAELERQRLRAQERFLFDTSERLSESLEVDQTLTIVADVSVPAVADWCVIHLVEGRDISLGLVRHRHAEGELALTRLVERFPASIDSDEAIAATVRDGQPRLIPVITQEQIEAAAAAGDERAEAFREMQLRSVLVVPLQARGRVVGTVTFGRDRAEPFDTEQQDMLGQLATRAALALDNAVTYERERSAALTLQHSLLPQISLSAPGLTIATRYIAGAAGAQVGGDWYDAIPLTDGRIGLTVGDVMGHGLASAALMGQVRAALRGVAATGGTPDAVLSVLDGVVGTLSSTQLVTCAYGIFDPRTSTLTYASAGHPAPLLIEPSGNALYLDVDPGAPLGVSVGDGLFPCHEIELRPGATLVLFTDGLVESRERPLADGLEALRLLPSRAERDLEALADRIVAAMHAGVTADDDTALLVLRVDQPRG